jgi:6-pyruvoyltetrahydropterin/6-carboxytetrahydropterin synthase
MTRPLPPADFWAIDERALFHPRDDTFFQISTDVFFNARHFVVFGNRQGPEHTHSFRLQATCRSQGLDREEQVVVGYHHLRQRMTQVVNAYNGQLLNELPPFRRLQPTTEVLTAVLFQQLDRLLLDLGLVLMSITVWESPTEAISFSRHDLGQREGVAACEPS